VINLIDNQTSPIIITNGEQSLDKNTKITLEVDDSDVLREIVSEDEIKPETSKDIGSTDVSSIDDTKPSDIQTRKDNGNAPAAGYNSEIINAYVKDFESRLRFIRLLKTSSYEQLEFKHANLLWNLLVENALNEKEREVFFTFFTSVIYSANST